MEKYTFKEIDFYKENNQTYFMFYQHGKLHYKVKHNVNGKWYEYTVPVSDAGDGKFQEQERAMLMKRYIGKAYREGNLDELV